MTRPANSWRARVARSVGTVAACICLGAPPAARSQDAASPSESQTSESQPLRIAALRAGFAGRFKVGCWTPFEIDLQGGSQAARGRVELVAPDGDGIPSRVRAPAQGELDVGPGEEKTVTLYAKLGRLAGDVTVDFRTASGLAASRRFAIGAEGPLSGVLPSTETLVVVVGADAAAAETRRPVLRGVEMARLDNVAALPTEWWGYEGATALILSTDDEALGSQLAKPRARLEALELWVRMGGKLVLSVGRHAEEVLAAGSPLESLAPGKLEGTVPLRRGSPLETYAETNEPLSADGPFALDVARLRNVRGQIEAFAGTQPSDLPLVVRTPRGFGEVVFLAFDLNRPPLADWTARPQLFDKLLGQPAAETLDDDSGTLRAVTTLGFVDLAGQLRGALDQFDGVWVVPFWFVALMVTAYIVCIGPLDYYLVKWVFRRMEATWLSFAVMVVVFSVGAYALAYGLKGRRVLVNHLDVVDYDLESRLVRGTSWSSVYSPTNATYDLSVAPLDSPAESAGGRLLFSWFGLPGRGFGGMDVAASRAGSVNAASQGSPLFNDPYDFAGRLDALRRVPLAVWSSKAFVARWWRQGEGGIEAQLVDDGTLAGTLACRLDTPLSDVVLIYGKWAYVIRDLAPGDRIDVETIDPQTADTYLRHVTIQGDRQIAAPYDTASFDVPQIVEMMTAHELAGGEKYTGLANQFQGFSELSDLVRRGRAVLLARGARPVARLLCDGRPVPGAETSNWTFYRFVLPVGQPSSEQNPETDG